MYCAVQTVLAAVRYDRKFRFETSWSMYNNRILVSNSWVIEQCSNHRVERWSHSATFGGKLKFLEIRDCSWLYQKCVKIVHDCFWTTYKYQKHHFRWFWTNSAWVRSKKAFFQSIFGNFWHFHQIFRILTFLGPMAQTYQISVIICHYYLSLL